MVNRRPIVPPHQKISSMKTMMMPMMLLLSCIPVGGLPSLPPDTSVARERLGRMGACPPCELLFRKLQPTKKDGKLAQVIRVQERGEPKSGTGMMFDWATGSLMHACDYLKHFFGQRSCRVDLTRREDTFGPTLDRVVERRMTFIPALGASGARCSCETVERVSIILSRADKHALPVNSSCAYSHNHGIELARIHEEEDQPRNAACKSADGTQITNHAGLWRCMHDASCDINDDWLQMVVFRDPRPAVVSAYFHLGVHSDMDLGPLKDFIARQLPSICQWLAIRYILFSGLLPHQSVVFWYNDALADPIEWHYHWFDAVGLQLPFGVVKNTAKAAAAGELRFNHKAIDVHPGEEARTGTGVRRFEDEVDPEVLEIADAVLRVWLPPVLLQKLGVAP